MKEKSCIKGMQNYINEERRRSILRRLPKWLYYPPTFPLHPKDARMECQVFLLSSGRNCQIVEVSNVSCCQIDDLSNPNGGWRNCKQKEVSNGGSVK